MNEEAVKRRIWGKKKPSFGSQIIQKLTTDGCNQSSSD